jgi:hypothetical protein
MLLIQELRALGDAEVGTWDGGNEFNNLFAPICLVPFGSNAIEQTFSVESSYICSYTLARYGYRDSRLMNEKMRISMPQLRLTKLFISIGGTC